MADGFDEIVLVPKIVLGNLQVCFVISQTDGFLKPLQCPRWIFIVPPHDANVMGCARHSMAIGALVPVERCFAITAYSSAVIVVVPNVQLTASFPCLRTSEEESEG